MQIATSNIQHSSNHLPRAMVGWTKTNANHTHKYNRFSKLKVRLIEHGSQLLHLNPRLHARLIELDNQLLHLNLQLRARLTELDNQLLHLNLHIRATLTH